MMENKEKKDLFAEESWRFIQQISKASLTEARMKFLWRDFYCLSEDKKKGEDIWEKIRQRIEE